MTDQPAYELSIIAPCLNEEGNIAELTRRTLRMFETSAIAGELIMVDDGSTDATWQRICEAVGADQQIIGVQHSANQGMEAAWRSGLEVARADVVCLIDADLQNRPEDVPRLYRAFGSGGFEVAQGVRIPIDVDTRTVISRSLNLLLNVTFRSNLRDNKSGFVLMANDTLRILLNHRFRYRYFQNFLGAASAVRGYRIVEIDTVFDDRYSGKSFLSDYPIGVSLRVLKELVMYRVEAVGIDSTRRPDQPDSSDTAPPDIQRQ